LFLTDFVLLIYYTCYLFDLLQHNLNAVRNNYIISGHFVWHNSGQKLHLSHAFDVKRSEIPRKYEIILL